MSLIERLKAFLAGAAKPAIIEIVRGYLNEKLSQIKPDDLLKAIESGDCDVFGKIPEEDLQIVVKVAYKYKDYLDAVRWEDIYRWLAEDQPFLAGIIYGHPRGLEWFRSLVEGARSQLKQAAEEIERKLSGAESRQVMVKRKSKSKEEATDQSPESNISLRVI